MRNDGRAGRLLRAWRGDYARRTLLSAGASSVCTALFAAYNGYLGVRHGSLWHGSIAGFYLLLTAVRESILLTESRGRTRPAAVQGRCRRRTFLVSSALLLALDLALILPVSMMAVLERPVSMGLIPAITMATYTTWKITMASVHIGRQRRRGSGILVAELRTVNFIDALVAVLTLQNTLIMVEGTAADGSAMLPLTAVSSGAIYAVIVAVTIRMLQKGLARTRQAEKANAPEWASV